MRVASQLSRCMLLCEQPEASLPAAPATDYEQAGDVPAVLYNLSTLIALQCFSVSSVCMYSSYCIDLLCIW